MIENIVILLLANTLIPLLPFPPQLAAPLPLIHFAVKQPTVYEYMNLTRLHTKQQFKRAFRQSLKVLHPDRGGDQVAFSKVKNLKKIMEQQVNYYDTLNITDVDLEYNIPFKDVVKVKQTTYYVQAGIYYFIVLLYALAYTIDDDMRPSRKYILPLILLFAGYQAYIHFHPQTITVIDLIQDKLPIFMQKTILKTTLSILVAIIRAKFGKRITQQKRVLSELKKQHTEQQYKGLLQNLCSIYQQKMNRNRQSQNSWATKIRGWISKGFTILILISLAKGFFGSGSSEAPQVHDL